MASVTKVNGKWRALVRRKGHAAQCKTFRTKSAADAWGRWIEGLIESGAQAPALPAGSPTLAKVIEAYRHLRDASRPIADTSNEHYMLRKLTNGLGPVLAAQMTPQDLVGYCTRRKDEGAGPYTCNMEISKLGTAMRYASASLHITLPDVPAAARPLLKHLGLIGGGGKRERRPTEDELVGIVTWLASEKGQLFADVVLFAVATAMRRGEIGRAAWADVDREKRLLLIRDRKDPRSKAGNDQWIPLLPAAWAVLEHQVAVDGDLRIFAIGESTVSKYFTEACVALAIPDLHFHDLRHEGTSRLFEDGYAIEQVALVTGHRDWRHLRRYTQLRPESLHRPKERPSS